MRPFTPFPLWRNRDRLLARAAAKWKANPPKDAQAFVEQREALAVSLRARLAQFLNRSHRAHYESSVVGSRYLAGAGGTAQHFADNLFWIKVHQLAYRIERMEPPSQAMPSVLDAAPFFTDDAAWTEAVASHGVELIPTDDYFTSTHWELFKDENLTGRCSLCGRGGQLALVAAGSSSAPPPKRVTTFHHVDYEHLGAEIVGRDVIELCWPCHRRHHGTDSVAGKLAA
jgi:hypothetical protein